MQCLGPHNKLRQSTPSLFTSEISECRPIVTAVPTCSQPVQIQGRTCPTHRCSKTRANCWIRSTNCRVLGMIQTRSSPNIPLQLYRVHVDIDLPQSVIIGNQSSGKSSVVEAICGIPLPRAAGTCTRCVFFPTSFKYMRFIVYRSCPTECRLSFSEAPWQCTVSLHVITDANGLTLGQARNEQFGGVIYEKSLVEPCAARDPQPKCALEDLFGLCRRYRCAGWPAQLLAQRSMPSDQWERRP